MFAQPHLILLSITTHSLADATTFSFKYYKILYGNKKFCSLLIIFIKIKKFNFLKIAKKFNEKIEKNPVSNSLNLTEVKTKIIIFSIFQWLN